MNRYLALALAALLLVLVFVQAEPQPTHADAQEELMMPDASVTHELAHAHFSALAAADAAYQQAFHAALQGPIVPEPEHEPSTSPSADHPDAEFESMASDAEISTGSRFFCPCPSEYFRCERSQRER